jgi:hypothetical protein
MPVKTGIQDEITLTTVDFRLRGNDGQFSHIMNNGG